MLLLLLPTSIQIKPLYRWCLFNDHLFNDCSNLWWTSSTYDWYSKFQLSQFPYSHMIAMGMLVSGQISDCCSVPWPHDCDLWPSCWLPSSQVNEKASRELAVMVMWVTHLMTSNDLLNNGNQGLLVDTKAKWCYHINLHFMTTLLSNRHSDSKYCH